MAGGNENSFGGVSHGPLNGSSATDVEPVPLQAWALALDTRHSADEKSMAFLKKRGQLRWVEIGWLYSLLPTRAVACWASHRVRFRFGNQ